MKKRNIVLKGILLFIVVGVIIGIIYQKNYTSISDETIISTAAESKRFDQTEIISSTSMIDNLVKGVSITTIDLTGLKTGDDVAHTHIYEKKYDSTYHWEECFICRSIINKSEHNLVTTGSGECQTYQVTYCTDGCGYSISTYIDHDLQPRSNIYDPTGKNTNTNTYYHIVSSCSRCGSAAATDKDGNTTSEGCIDAQGQHISCSNRGICVKCGYDYSKLENVSHQSIILRSDKKTYYCQYCNKDMYEVLYEEAIQDDTNNLHWSLMGIFKLENNITWKQTTNLATWSPVLASGALSSLGSATVTDLDAKYYDKEEYGTKGITSGLYKVQYQAYIRDGYQGMPVVRLNADNCFSNVNGNSNEFAKTYAINKTISPDTIPPVITNVQINKEDIVNNFSKKATITVECTDNYSDTVSIGLYTLSGTCISEYGSAQNNGNLNFSRSFDVVAEIRETETLVVKAKDRFGNESSKNIEVQYLDAKAPELVSDKKYINNWSKLKSVTLVAEDYGIGNVQIGFNDASEYSLADKNGDAYTRTYNFIGDVYDSVVGAVYLKDELGNEQMVKVEVGLLDNTSPTITSATLNNNKVIIEGNDYNSTLQAEGSGISQYRYITSNTKLTNPSITDSNSTTVSKDDGVVISNINTVNYIYVQALDLVGNVSNTVEVEVPDLVLSSNVNLSAANGKGGVDLDWSSYDATDKTFKAYQKKEGSDEWESISLLDFNSEMEEINVLNVYPVVSTSIPTVTFNYLDGTSVNLKKSAALKVWMEGGTMVESDGTTTTFEAYGKNPYTGQQLLHVTPVTSDEFNLNPEMIWNYDMVMFGTWDTNGAKTDQPNDVALDIIEKYIQSGYGVLVGHDTIGYKYNGIGLSKLRKYFNIEVGYWSSGYETISDTDYQDAWGYMSSYVKVNRNGLLTNFPWEIPLGSILSVPTTHTCANAALGNVWMDFVDGYYTSANTDYTTNYYSYGKGDGYYYLTTYNNTAMIQTGHSNCNSTTDERKVLANTLFYLKQLSSATSFTDNSSQDLKAPDKPTLSVNGIENNKINVSYSTKDNGNIYSFYVESYDKSDSTIVLATSNKVTETVTTGLKGYYYVIDDNEINDFNISDAIFVNQNQLNLDISNNGKYIHIKAVDVAGNVSEVTTEQIYIESTLTINPNGGTLNGSTSIVSQTGLVGKTIDLGTPARIGYTFDGWDITAGEISGTVFTYVTEDVRATAKWIGNEYTVKYNGNGATSGSTANSSHIYDIAKNLTTNGYERKYTVTYNHNYTGSTDTQKIATYTFKNWNTQADGNGVSYEDEASVINLTSTSGATINMYAQWTSASVSYTPTRVGYRFAGWYSEAECTNKVSDGTYTPTSNITLYAKWEIDETQTKDLSYTVEYYKDNIKVDADTQTVEITVQLLQPDTLTVDKAAINTTDKYEGYRLDKTEPTAIPETIATGSTIKVYYVKRSDLSYSVKYLEKDTNKELATTKTVGNQIFESTATESAIDIEGYDKVDPTEKSIQIAVSGNEIVFYYTKRTDLSYTVKYLEKDTNVELATAKTVGNQTFESTATEQAINIEGYDKVDPTEKSIQIAVSGNEIIFYYTKRTDLSYTVKYLEKDTNVELATAKTVENQTYENTVTEQAIEINGYDKVDPTEKSIQIVVSGNEIIFYYTKRTDLSYIVKYLEQDTDTELATAKTVENQTFENIVTEQAINIEGYDKVEPTEKSIQIAVSENEIVFYYTKRTDLGYTVKYLEKDTNKELSAIKTVNNRTYQETVTEQAIDIEGYDKVDPTEKSIQIAVSGNEIAFYYTKRTDLSYTVKYLEKDTNVELEAAKTVGNQTFESTATEQAIDINGYDKVDPTEKSIQIAVSGNEIIFYYTKRTDLSYTVKYLEQDTNRELATAKTVGNQIFESTATEQAIDIEGYDKVEPIEKTIQIAVSGNEIIFYYTKRTDLSYTVKYLEQDTNTELSASKTVENQTFENTVTEQAIEINGYDKVEPTEKSIQIAVSGNKIVFYYTKRTDLSYIVKYLEQDTNVELATAKTVGNQIFESTTTEQAIDINGYDKVDPTEKSIQIAVTGNEIVFYYTKRVDLSYKVNYLLKDNDEDNSNNNVLHEQKIVNNQRFKDEITTRNEVIDIYGYKLDSIDKEILTIETTENVINIYYVIDEAQTKELSYTVEYYINGEKQEDDTVVVNQTVQVLKPDTLPMKQELIDDNKYTGYEIDTTKEIPEIVNNGGIVEIHYKNRTFGYKVKYYFNGYVDEVLTEEKRAEYLDVIDTYEDKIKEGYKFDQVENCPLTITEKEDSNVIKVYYKTDQTVIKEVTYEILYYKDGVVVDRRTVTRRVQVLLPDKVAVDKTLVETDRYEDSNFVKTEPEEIPDLIESGETISVYYESKISQVVVKYIDKITGQNISDDVIQEGKVGDTYTIEQKEIEGYTLIESPERTGTITEEAQEKVFYYAKNAEVKVKYLEKDTRNVLADEELITGYEGKEYETTSKEIENYELVETVGIPSGIMSSGTQEVIYYYSQKTKVTVNHIDVISNETLETETIEGKVGDEYTTSSRDFEGYVLQEKPEQENGIMTKEEIVINYYYKHVSDGVIVKHIDKVSGEILDNETIEGNEGDEYTTTPKEFEGYDLDETLLPENASGKMTKELIEVKYYYVRKAIVKVEYLDRNTLEEVASSELLKGHEGDAYTSTPKEIEDYYLVESMLPENSTGTMTKEEITVTYYYVKKSAGVIEKHINEKTEEILEEKLHEGLIGDDYKTSSKDFEGYDLDITKLPENAEGKMTEELIEVKYYYIRKAQVRVEYIDEFTNELIEQDIITGHEDDSYTTTSKDIKGYIIDEEKIPDNKDGIMIITVNEDGTVTSEIVVKYYYKKISAGVLEKHIDIKTNDVLEEKFYSGNVGDTYKTTSKEYEKYDLVTSQLPENAEGTMTEDLIEVNYYYIRKATVRVEYVDNASGEKISEDTIIEGHEDDEYKTTAKEIKDYTLNKDKLPENAEGTMKVVRSEYFVDEVKTETVVTYYYDKVKKPEENKDSNNSNNTKPDNKPNDSNKNNNGNSNNNTSNNNNNNSNGKAQTIIISTDSSNTSKANTNNTSSTTQNNKTTMPSTGDMKPIIATALILLVSLVNIVQIIISRRKKDSK